MRDVRALAALSLSKVVANGESFSGQLEELDSSQAHYAEAELDNNHANAQAKVHPRDLAFYRELCYGTLRHYFFLDAIASSMLAKPLAKKDNDVYLLLLLGIYQLLFLRTPDHAAINATVNACIGLKKNWAKKLVNGVLRNFLRKTKQRMESSNISDVDERSCWLDIGDAAVTASHPAWLYKAIASHWPTRVDDIIAYNNHPPGMALRVCESHISVDHYLALLAREEIAASRSTLSATAISLGQSVDVARLPHFAEGWVSVQDVGAQLAAELLHAEPASQVLDACAAPGGKTTHLLQRQPSLTLTAIDHSAERLAQVADNLQRCGLNAKLVHADAGETNAWWDGQCFDRILLDAPCSGTGVISHHPDIKILRRNSDIARFARQQLHLLERLWPTLKVGGKLLYCTCSIMPEENHLLIEQFLARTPSAKSETLNLPVSDHRHLIKLGAGHQLLPNKGENGGFFYARLSKLGQL